MYTTFTTDINIVPQIAKRNQSNKLNPYTWMMENSSNSNRSKKLNR